MNNLHKLTLIFISCNIVFTIKAFKISIHTIKNSQKNINISFNSVINNNCTTKIKTPQ